MKIIGVLLIAIMWCGGAAAQDNYFPTKKGTELSYKYYDRRGKPLKDQWKNLRWMKFTVEDVWPQEDGIVINVAIANEIIEKLAKSKITEQVAENVSYGDVKIQGDSVVWDNMQWVASVIPEFFAYMTAHGGDGPKYRLELAALSSFPCTMSVGERLRDESILDAKYFEILSEEQIAERDKRMEEMRAELRVMYGGSFPSAFNSNPSIDVKAKTRNRKVEAFEQVETPAGTFDCYKISYELLIPSAYDTYSVTVIDGMVSSESVTPPADVYKFADWISPKVGLVKREKYNNRGKIEEVMILDSITE